MKIIAIIGKTASGKDTVARYISKNFGIDQIVSYTTREKRPSEVDGREHYFISKEEMNKLKEDKDNILAYTIFDKTNVEYCASVKGLDADGVYIYIIDPKGLSDLLEKKNIPTLQKVYTIGLYCDEEVIKKHALGRGDTIEKIEERLDSEREQFDNFFNTTTEPVINTDKPLEDIFMEVNSLVTNFVTD